MPSIHALPIPLNAKEIVKKISRIVNEHRLTYDQFNNICSRVRYEHGLVPRKQPKRLPRLLTDDELERFYNVLSKIGSVKHQVMLRLLFYTAVRVSEFTSIMVDDVDLSANKILIRQGKGKKDRYLLFPSDFKLTLQVYIGLHANGNKYLFESTFRRRYSSRRIQQIVAQYASDAGLVGVHPHTFRHQMLTWLGRNKVSDAQIQLISGHASRKSLEVYQHLGLEDVREDYQKAMKGLKGL